MSSIAVDKMKFPPNGGDSALLWIPVMLKYHMGSSREAWDYLMSPEGAEIRHNLAIGHTVVKTFATVDFSFERTLKRIPGDLRGLSDDDTAREIAFERGEACPPSRAVEERQTKIDEEKEEEEANAKDEGGRPTAVWRTLKGIMEKCDIPWNRNKFEKFDWLKGCLTLEGILEKGHRLAKLVKSLIKTPSERPLNDSFPDFVQYSKTIATGVSPKLSPTVLACAKPSFSASKNTTRPPKWRSNAVDGENPDPFVNDVMMFSFVSIVNHGIFNPARGENASANGSVCSSSRTE